MRATAAGVGAIIAGLALLSLSAGIIADLDDASPTTAAGEPEAS